MLREKIRALAQMGDLTFAASGADVELTAMGAGARPRESEVEMVVLRVSDGPAVASEVELGTMGDGEELLDLPNPPPAE